MDERTIQDEKIQLLARPTMQRNLVAGKFGPVSFKQYADMESTINASLESFGACPWCKKKETMFDYTGRKKYEGAQFDYTGQKKYENARTSNESMFDYTGRKKYEDMDGLASIYNTYFKEKIFGLFNFRNNIRNILIVVLTIVLLMIITKQLKK